MKRQSQKAMQPKQLTELKKLVAKAAVIAGQAPELTAVDRRRSAKLPADGAAVVHGLVVLCRKHGLDLPSMSPDTMAAEIAQYEAIDTLLVDVRAFLNNLEDRAFIAGGTSWAIATATYKTLQRIGKTNGEIAQALSFAQQYFAKSGRRTGKKKPAIAAKPNGAVSVVVAPATSSKPADGAVNGATSVANGVHA